MYIRENIIQIADILVINFHKCYMVASGCDCVHNEGHTLGLNCMLSVIHTSLSEELDGIRKKKNIGKL